IDSCMRLGAGMSEGPLEMADRLGLDVIHHNLQNFCNEYKDFKYRPHPWFNGMIRAGQFGRKSGRGFYHYA
ncbi:MAG: 3-hydroxyacyl-CoA dehydrogenase family protein, partial [Syntrophomonadaceae bacterium]|nr:3-hydroxyacyl-CoA dehydrogenase family protein [Syntrophomonadaceae bacterium]